MKKTLQKVLFVLAAMAVAFVSFSCSQTVKEAVWYQDYEEATAAAKEQDKNILLFFTGLDWDTISQSLVQNVFESEIFLKKVAPEYILTQLDFSQAEGSISEDQFMKNYDVANRFTLEGIPQVLLTTNEGFVISSIETTSDITDADAYVKLITNYNKQSDKVLKTSKKMNSSEGITKVKHIDTLADLLDSSYSYLLADLFAQITELDPENESDLYGKYLLQLTYPKAMEAFSSGNQTEAVGMFLEIAEGGLLNTKDIQEAYYSAAYLYSQTENSDDTIILDYLQRSYNTDTESEAAESILTAINYIETSMQEEIADEETLPEEGPSLE